MSLSIRTTIGALGAVLLACGGEGLDAYQSPLCDEGGLLTDAGERDLLAALNDRRTGVETLKAGGVNGSVALNLMDRRDGPDRVLGSRDDAPFLSLADVDSVPAVGPTALDALAAYAAALDGGCPCGLTVSGVRFSQSEAMLTLAVANSASEDDLDVRAGLTRPAARAIAENRPFTSLLELAALPSVHAGSLERLRGFSQAW